MGRLVLVWRESVEPPAEVGVPFLLRSGPPVSVPKMRLPRFFGISALVLLLCGSTLSSSGAASSLVKRKPKKRSTVAVAAKATAGSAGSKASEEEKSGLEKKEESQDQASNRSKETPAIGGDPDPVGCVRAWDYWSATLDECHANITMLEKQINSSLTEQDRVIERNFKVLGKQADDLRNTHEDFTLGNKYLRPQRTAGFLQVAANPLMQSNLRSRAVGKVQLTQKPAGRSARYPRLEAKSSGKAISREGKKLLDFPVPLRLADEPFGKKHSGSSGGQKHSGSSGKEPEPYSPPRCECAYDDKCQCLGSCQQLTHHCMALKEQIVIWGTKAYNDRLMIIAEQDRRIHASPELEQRLRELDPEAQWFVVPVKKPAWMVLPKNATKDA